MLPLLLLVPLAMATSYDIPKTNPDDSWSTSGTCYPVDAVSGLTLKGSDKLQTELLCESQCGRQAIVALLNGGMCYCGDTYPLQALAVDSSFCNVPCYGYGQKNCGGSKYYMVYENSTPKTAKTASSLSSSTSTSSTLSSTSTSTTSSKTSSTTTSSSSTSSSTKQSSKSSSSSSQSTESSSSQSSANAAIIVSTVTTTSSSTNSASPSPASPSASSTSSDDQDNDNDDDDNDKDDSNHKSVSGKTIAGAVVGSIVGAALIAGIIFFFLRRRLRGDSDSDVEDDFILSGPGNEKNNLNPPPVASEPNPFLLAGGYKFGNDQQSQFVGVPSSISDNSTSFGHSRQTSQLHGGTNSFNSHGEEFYYDDGSHLQRPTMGSKKLSAGSLPDIMGGTRSLKVVNN